MKGVDDPEPKWLDAGNDQSHQEVIAPLFGTGNLNLIDVSGDSDDEDDSHDGDDSDDNDEEIGKPFVNNKGGSNYGAITSTNSNNKNTIDDDPSVVSSNSSRRKNKVNSNSNFHNSNSSLLSVQSNSSKKKKNKKKKSRVSRIVVTESGKPEMPRRNCLLAVFHFIQGFGVITSLCMIATQITPMLLIPIKELGAMSFILKIYVSLFCFLFLLLEWDAPIPYIRDATFLQKYLSRGFLYSFLGLSCLEEAYSERVNDMVAHAGDQFHVSWYSLFMQITSWMMVGLGLLYMLFGLCCVKALRDRLVREYKERWEDYRDAMEEYKAKRLK